MKVSIAGKYKKLAIVMAVVLVMSSISWGMSAPVTYANETAGAVTGAKSGQDTENDSEDIRRFREFLSREVSVPWEDGKLGHCIADFYGWDVEDITTWDGISFDSEGNITEIDLPLDYEEGSLDLSGFSKLKKLTIMLSDIDSINLSGCSELTDLYVSYCENIKTIDLRDCTKLESVDLDGNQLTNIYWGECSSLRKLSCTHNYLDVIGDDSFTKIVDIVEGNNGFTQYLFQYPNPDWPYEESDVAYIKEFLSKGENQQVLGWDLEDVSSWTGIQWRPVSGKNHIYVIEIMDKRITGELDLTGIPYIDTLNCISSGISSINVRGLKYLRSLQCVFCKLKKLTVGDNDALQFVDCTYNYLDVSEIEDYMETIKNNQGITVDYKRQLIDAPAEDFSLEERQALQKIQVSEEGPVWDLDRPGDMIEIIWQLVDGKYRAESMESDYLAGDIDLSDFAYMKNVKLSLSDIESVILPPGLEKIGEGAFRSCFKLKKIVVPEGVKSIETKAFYYCYDLQDIVFEGDAPEELESDIFSKSMEPENITIHYHRGTSGWNNPYWTKFNLSCIEDENDSGNPSHNGNTLNTQSNSEKSPGSQNKTGVTTKKSVKVPGTKIVKITQTKKKVNVTIKKVKNVSGYEISYKKGKKGKYKKLILSSKKKKAVLLNLKNKKNYYIRVRAFISKDGKKYYSAYSKVKKIKKR